MKQFNEYLKVRKQIVLINSLLCLLGQAHAAKQLAVEVFADSAFDLLSVTSMNQLQVQTGDGSGHFSVTAPL